MNGEDRGGVLQIFIVADAGEPMQEVCEVGAILGKGLEGDRYADRYASDRGIFSKAREAIRHATLIEIEAIRVANSYLNEAILPEETRRNIVVNNFPLNGLVGKEFTVGQVRMRGVELCTPCNRPSKLADKPGFREAFSGRGGLRVEILSSGSIRVGDFCLR